MSRRRLLCAAVLAACGWRGTCAAAATAGVAGAAGLAQRAGLCAVGSVGAALWPGPEQPPLVRSWLAGEPAAWPLPDCSGLPDVAAELLVEVSASYRDGGAPAADLSAQLLRLGAVSALAGMRYWSFSDGRREQLVEAAFAVDGPRSQQPRADFTLAELRAGQPLWWLQRDNRSAGLVHYRLQVLQADAQRLRLVAHNVDDVRWLGLTLVGAGELQWLQQLDRLPDGRVGWRGLAALQHLRLGGAAQNRRAQLARVVAWFDHLAGRETDLRAFA